MTIPAVSKIAFLAAACLWETFLVPGIAEAGPQNLPNLIPTPPSHIAIGEADTPEDPDTPAPTQALRFATTTYNRGDHPLDLLFMPTSVEDVLADGREVMQCDLFVTPVVCADRISAGRAVYHPAHGHWHIEDYAWYALVPVTIDGLPDFEATPVAPGVKASFCLMDSDGPDGESNGFIGYSDCGNLRQGINQNYGDTYGPGLPGQQIVIDHVAPDIYGLVITINPIGRLHETTLSDNRSWAVIDLTAPAEDGTVPILRSGVS